jgi:uncharacterized repeat protein (TIGR01451 family)
MNLKNILVALTFLTLASILAGFAQQEPEPAEKGDLVRQRLEWFYNQRAYPLKHIPAGIRLRALEQLDRMLAAEGQLTTAATTVSSDLASDVSAAAISSTAWTLIGPQPTNTPYNVPIVAGRVSALAVDPTNPNVVYAGAAGGGVWKTTDGGIHWTPLTDKQPSLAVGSIAIDPSNHSVIYVGTGEENFSADSYFGAGILKSINAGTSWTQIKGPFVGQFSLDGKYFFGGAAHIGAIAIEPGNSSVMLVAVEMSPDTNNLNFTNVYRTDDGGITWTSVLPISSNVPDYFKWGTAVLFDPNNGNIAYAAISGPFNSCTACNSGVYKSLDAGKTWIHIYGTGNNILPQTNLGRIALAIAPSNPNTIYAGIQDTSTFGLLGLFKTTDGGANWIKLANTPNYCVPQCWYDQAIAVAPNNPNVVFVGGAGGNGIVYRSTNGGLNWTDVTQGANGFALHADLHALAFSADSSVLYLGNDGGVWRASPPTATPVPWTELNDALAITEFYFSPSINPKDVANSFGGTQDNGTQEYGGLTAWNDVVCGDGGWTAIDPLTPSNVYSTCPQGNGVIWKSTAGGVFGSWSYAAAGINVGEAMEFLPPLAIDTLHPSNLYFGTYRIYQSTNNAVTWSIISGDLTHGQAVSTIAVAPTDSNTVYAGTADGLFQVTLNALAGAGAVWNNRTSGLPQRFITHVAVDPHISTTAYVALSGFNAGHVFRTTDGGLTWKDISGNLPNIPVNAIAIDPVLTNTYYVATDIGVFRTRNGGLNWSSLGTGLPRVAVLGITLHNPTRTLRASTHGRSMWDIHVPIADLSMVMTESPNPVPHGTNLKYSLNVTNKGPDIATNAVVSDTTPVGTTFVSATTSAGTCTAPAVGTTGTLSCKVGNLASGAKATVTMTIKDTASAGSILTDTGRTSSGTPDPNAKNNAVTIKTNVN